MRKVTILPTFESWRHAARSLLAGGVVPSEVLFDDGQVATLPGLSSSTAIPAQDRQLVVPRRLVEQATVAADHRDADRWNFLYRLLWRVWNEPNLLDNLTDPDVRRLDLMVKSVRRDVHKMHAFVRFRKVSEEEGERYIAFHRPDHHIVRRAAPFFRDRFGGMRWAILTPDQSVSWDGHQLCFTEGVEASAAPQADELEDVWRTYYASVFNPARIKLGAMKAEMPVRHWRTLPETQIIGQLLQEAPQRVETMMANAASTKAPGAEAFIPATRSLPKLAAAAKKCQGCDLCCLEGTQAVFGEGPARAKVIFVGEQPGDTEDRAGRPFVGPAGQLMDELLDEAGVDRGKVYVTNAVKHFNYVQKGSLRLHQKPAARHVNACRPWFEAEVEAIHPKMVVALGSTAAQAIMGRDFRVTKQRGEVMACPYAPWFMATLHPSALLRIPDDEARAEAKGAFIDDMRKVARAMKDAAA